MDCLDGKESNTVSIVVKETLMNAMTEIAASLLSMVHVHLVHGNCTIKQLICDKYQ